jgi:hypothetical protein
LITPQSARVAVGAVDEVQAVAIAAATSMAMME